MKIAITYLNRYLQTIQNQFFCPAYTYSPLWAPFPPESVMLDKSFCGENTQQENHVKSRNSGQFQRKIGSFDMKQDSRMGQMGPKSAPMEQKKFSPFFCCVLFQDVRLVFWFGKWCWGEHNAQTICSAHSPEKIHNLRSNMGIYRTGQYHNVTIILQLIVLATFHLFQFVPTLQKSTEKFTCQFHNCSVHHLFTITSPTHQKFCAINFTTHQQRVRGCQCEVRRHVCRQLKITN